MAVANRLPQAMYKAHSTTTLHHLPPIARLMTGQATAAAKKGQRNQRMTPKRREARRLGTG